MIPEKLTDYIKIYNNILDKKECKSAVKNLKNINWQEHTFYNYATNKTVSYDRELSVSNDNIPEKKVIMKNI